MRLVDPIGQAIAGFRWRILPRMAFAMAIVALAPRSARAQEINTMCPVMTEEEVDPEMTITFRGKTVGFCCDICIAKFKANPDRYLPRLPQFASAPDSGAAGSADPTSDQGAVASRPDASIETAADDGPWWGRVHPVLVHFPLAGMPLALLGFLAWIRRGSESFAKADVAPLLVATVAAILAVNSGKTLKDALGDGAASWELIANDHEWYSERIMVLAIALSVLRIWRWNRMTGKWRWVYGGGLLLVCGMLGYTGFLGGSLVFGPDHLKW